MLIRFFLVRMDQGEDEADDHGDEADAEEDEEDSEEGLHKAGTLRKGCCERRLRFFFTKIANRGLFFLKILSYLYRLFAAI